MTEDEINIIVERVIASLASRSKTIGQLTAVTSLSDEDSFEVSQGRRVSYATLAKLIVGSAGDIGADLGPAIANKDLVSVEFDASTDGGSISVSNKVKTVTAVIGACSDTLAGLLTPEQLATILSKLDKSVWDANFINGVKTEVKKRLDAQQGIDTTDIKAQSASVSGNASVGGNSVVSGNSTVSGTQDVKQLNVRESALIEGGLSAETVSATDVISDNIKSANGFKSSDYLRGAKGASLYKDSDGKWHVDTDVVDARMKITATEIEVKKETHIGGGIMLSAASMKITKVETGSAYRCYMNLTDGTDTITNDWMVGDQALCKTFNLTTNRYYWRLVTAVGADYIELSVADKDSITTDVPIGGDEIVQFGYRGSDTSRQGAMELVGAGSGAPYIRQYKGVKSFTIPEPTISLDGETNIIHGELYTESGDKVSGKLASLELTANGLLSSVSDLSDADNELSSRITQTANSISLQVNGAQQAFPNLISGGRLPIVASVAQGSYNQKYYYNNGMWLWVKPTGTDATITLKNVMPAEYIGKQVTLSYEVLALDSSLNSKATPTIYNGTVYLSSNGTLVTGQVVKAWATFTYSSSYALKLRALSGGGYLIRNIMLNVGSYAQPYSANAQDGEDMTNYLANTQVALSGDATSGNIYGTASDYYTSKLKSLAGKVINISFDVTWSGLTYNSSRNQIGVELVYKYGASATTTWNGGNLRFTSSSAAAGTAHVSEQIYVDADLVGDISPSIFIKAPCVAAISHVMITVGKEYPWTDCTETLVKKLNSTGIDIENELITISSKKTIIVDEDGKQIAMFSDGKLSAALIDTDVLTAKKLRTAESGARIVAESNGLSLYNSSGVRKMLISAEKLPAYSGLANTYYSMTSASLYSTSANDYGDDSGYIASGIAITSANNIVTIPQLIITPSIPTASSGLAQTAWVSVIIRIAGTTYDKQYTFFYNDGAITIPATQIAMGIGTGYALTWNIRIDYGNTDTGEEVGAKISMASGAQVSVEYPQPNMTMICDDGTRSQYGNFIFEATANGIKCSSDGGGTWKSLTS